MQIYKKKRASHSRKLLEKVFSRKSSRIFLLGIYTIVIILSGLFLYRSEKIRNTLKNIALDSKKSLRTLKSSIISKPETIIIDIKFQDFEKIAKQRNQALEKGIHIVSGDAFVPATISHKEKNLRARIRLRGLFTDHWSENEKWSYKVQIRDFGSVFSMTDFALMHPKTREYEREWLFMKALEMEELPFLRMKFVKVIINGKNQGIYALVEEFSDTALENSKLRIGPIVGYSKDLLIQEWERGLARGESPAIDIQSKPELSEGVVGAFNQASIEVNAQNKTLSDPIKRNQFIKAASLLEAFRTKQLKTSEVFDVEKLAKYLSLRALFSAYEFDPSDTEFYYNPVSGKLEPIGGEITSSSPVGLWWLNQTEDRKSPFVKLFFNDPIFYEEYIKHLSIISKPEYLDNLFTKVNDELENNLNILYSEFSQYDFSKENYYQNQKYIESVLNPSKAIHAYLVSQTTNSLKLEIGNIQSLPIRILNAKINDVVFTPSEELVLLPNTRYKPPDYQIVNFNSDRDYSLDENIAISINISYKILGTEETRVDHVYPYPRFQKELIIDSTRNKPNIFQFDFIWVNDDTKEIFIKQGYWNIDQTIIIPAGYRVIGKSSTTLNLSNQASIVSYSPFNIQGSEDSPFIIQSTDSSGNGLILLETNKLSTLNHVIVSNLSAPASHGWQVTGAVTFYKSPVKIQNSIFQENRSEDALNIINSKIEINDSVFRQTQFDALDLDFVEGTIRNITFIDIGNDAIDLSGSVTEINDIIIKSAKDKGISIGEKSTIIARNIKINNSKIAIAVKDLSELKMEKIIIKNSTYGIAVYQKKAEFGPASVHATDFSCENVESDYLVEDGSFLMLNAKQIKADKKDLKTLLYDN